MNLKDRFATLGRLFHQSLSINTILYCSQPTFTKLPYRTLCLSFLLIFSLSCSDLTFTSFPSDVTDTLAAALLNTWSHHWLVKSLLMSCPRPAVSCFSFNKNLQKDVAITFRESQPSSLHNPLTIYKSKE